MGIENCQIKQFRSASFQFFPIFICEKKMATKETVEDLFKKRDTDGDGLLTHSELKEFMNERGDEYTDSEINEAIKMADSDDDDQEKLFKIADTDGDGLLGADELKKFLI